MKSVKSFFKGSTIFMILSGIVQFVFFGGLVLLLAMLFFYIGEHGLKELFVSIWEGFK